MNFLQSFLSGYHSTFWKPFSITLKINQNDTTIRPYQSIETDDTSCH
jgi:hypothetical protein